MVFTSDQFGMASVLYFVLDTMSSSFYSVVRQYNIIPSVVSCRHLIAVRNSGHIRVLPIDKIQENVFLIDVDSPNVP